MDYSMVIGTSQEVDIGQIERLEDERFPWAERRRKAVDLAQIYDYAGYRDYAERVGSCATWLQFNGMFDGSKTLSAANFCQLRLCPMCMARRAKKAVCKLSQVMNAVQAAHGCRYIFLTLTVRNCAGTDLSATMGLLTKGWYRLVDQRAVDRAVKGWYRAIETTRNTEEGSEFYGTFHPHIHAVLAVMPEYFEENSPLYITQLEWRRRWAQAARLDYDPSVDIRATYKRCGSDTDDSASYSATVEAAKYATKDKDYIDPRLSMEEAAEVVTVYTEALRRRRLTAFGGWLKEEARRQNVDHMEDDSDLVHIDDNHVREDLADMILTYNWNLGVGDYILAARQLNSVKLVVDERTGEVVAV